VSRPTHVLVKQACYKISTARFNVQCIERSVFAWNLCSVDISSQPCFVHVYCDSPCFKTLLLMGARNSVGHLFEGDCPLKFSVPPSSTEVVIEKRQLTSDNDTKSLILSRTIIWHCKNLERHKHRVYCTLIDN